MKIKDMVSVGVIQWAAACLGILSFNTILMRHLPFAALLRVVAMTVTYDDNNCSKSAASMYTEGAGMVSCVWKFIISTKFQQNKQSALYCFYVRTSVEADFLFGVKLCSRCETPWMLTKTSARGEHRLSLLPSELQPGLYASRNYLNLNRFKAGSEPNL